MKQEPIDQVDLKRRLLADEMSWQEALQIITSLRSPPWQSKEWKTKRVLFLGERCEQCGTDDPPLVLQHLWHPTRTSQIFYDLRRKLLNEWYEWQRDHPIEPDFSNIPADTNVCPKCSSPTIRFRKTMKNWKCVAQVAGVVCGHDFDFPFRAVSNAKKKEIEKAARHRSMEQFDNAFGIGKAAVTIVIDQHIRYMSLEDTTTLCKRCAFVADKTEMVFCQRCRANYHLPAFAQCATCAGVGNRVP